MKLLDALLACIYLCVCIVRFVEFTYFLPKFGSLPVEIFFSALEMHYSTNSGTVKRLDLANWRFTTVALSPIVLSIIIFGTTSSCLR